MDPHNVLLCDAVLHGCEPSSSAGPGEWEWLCRSVLGRRSLLSLRPLLLMEDDQSTWPPAPPPHAAPLQHHQSSMPASILFQSGFCGRPASSQRCLTMATFLSFRLYA